MQTFTDRRVSRPSLVEMIEPGELYGDSLLLSEEKELTIPFNIQSFDNCHILVLEKGQYTQVLRK